MGTFYKILSGEAEDVEAELNELEENSCKVKIMGMTSDEVESKDDESGDCYTWITLVVKVRQ